MGERRTALLLRLGPLGLYTPPPSRTASSGRFVGGRPQTPARLGVANPPGPISVSDPTRGTDGCPLTAHFVESGLLENEPTAPAEQAHTTQRQ